MIGLKPAEAAGEVDPKVIESFKRALTPDALEMNVHFLDDFLGECARRNVQVVILEGQYNPLATSQAVLKLNSEVVSALRGFEQKYAHVTVIPRDKLYAFQVKDYKDLSHVQRDAAIQFNSHLSSLLLQYFE
jgi:hypothetical protein